MTSVGRSLSEPAGSDFQFLPARWLLAIPALIAVLYLCVAGMLEGYCFVWPSIDTVYAPDFTERKFKQIEVGMREEEVVALIGLPFRTDRYSRGHPAYKVTGDNVWSYTHDGAAPFGDWAWLSREVIFRNGSVVQKVYWTFHD
jgi:hypothetical protein